MMHSVNMMCRAALGSRKIVGAVLAFTAGLVGVSSSSAAELIAQAEIAAAPPAVLRVDVSSACVGQGAVFKIVNRGSQWPRTSLLRLYYTDDNSLIGQRRLRLADNQRVSFAVNDKVAAGRPIGVWLDPGWYKRGFQFDAEATCS
ncbi:hypothetical protein [Magnetovibrio sp.]|uniref:hypothetical protein n=1 Tax=Magnetovibrio sp. TaxID=2024836 RepID=UPI002F93EB69